MHIAATLKGLAKDILGFSVVDMQQPLLDAGFDSLSAIEFASAVSKKFEVNLPRTLVFDFPSMQSIADKLKNEFDTVDVSNEAVPLPVTGHVISSASFMLPFSLKSAGMLHGLDCVTEVPFARLDLDECWDFEPRENFTYTKHAACMDNVEWFDANFFGITAAEARAMDPQQRLLLHVAVSANCNAVAKSRTAVFVGQANHDWSAQSNPVTSYIGAALSPAITSNRLSYHFQLQGPSMTIDTACSSSLVALTVARGKGMASSVVAGTHVMLSTLPFIGSCAATMLSKHGRCLTFDSSADGYCRGEGVAALILQAKNEKDAPKNAICEVNGSATNHNGRSASLTAPNGIVQESLFHATLASASVELVDFVELHGTGTKLGDPVEPAMMAVFKKSQNMSLSDNVITCGAVKSNVGHLEGSAGVAGLFKLISALCKKAAPPNVHIRHLNPLIADIFFPNAGTVPASLFPDALMSLDATLGLHGAVSSFGFGGSNAQAILSPCKFNLRWEMAESKPNVFLPWRRPLSPLLTQREGTSIFDMRMLKFKHLFEDHAIGGRVFVEMLFSDDVFFKCDVSALAVSFFLQNWFETCLCSTRSAIRSLEVLDFRDLTMRNTCLPNGRCFFYHVSRPTCEATLPKLSRPNHPSFLHDHHAGQRKSNRAGRLDQSRRA